VPHQNFVVSRSKWQWKLPLNLELRTLNLKIPPVYFSLRETFITSVQHFDTPRNFQSDRKTNRHTPKTNMSADELKAAGNKAIAEKNFDEAV
jgi:hypothetical protein